MHPSYLLQPWEITKNTPLSARIDGHKTVGMVVLAKAAELAVEKCKKSGFGIVGTHNTFTSTGALAYYGDYIARHGFLGFVYAGSPEMVRFFVNVSGSFLVVVCKIPQIFDGVFAGSVLVFCLQMLPNFDGVFS